MTEGRRGARAAEALAVAALAAVFLHAVTFRQGTFVYQFHKASTGAWIDEGARVAAGEVPYRDFHDRVGPGIFYLNAALVRVGGGSLDAVAWAGVVTGAALAAGLLLLSAAVVRGRWRLAPPLAFTVLVYPPFDLGHHKWPALLLVLCALGLTLDVRDRPLRALAAGAACGLGTVFTPVLGLAAAAGLLLHIRREGSPRRGLLSGALLVGMVAAVAAPATLLLARGAREVTASWFGALLAARPVLMLPGRWSAFNAVWIALALAGAAAAVWVLRAPGGTTEAHRLLGRTGPFLLAATAASYVDPYALAVHATPLLALAAAAAERLGRDRPLARRAAAALVATAVAAAGLAQVVWRQRVQPLTRQAFRAGEAWIGAPNVELPWIESVTRPGDAVFVFPAGGGSFFLTRTRNATSLPFVIEGQATMEDQVRALAEIEAVRPESGVWMGGQRGAPGGGASLDTLFEGILRSYRPDGTLPDGTLLLRRRY